MLKANVKVERSAFMAAAQKAIQRADRARIKPAFRGLIVRIVTTLVEGGYGYAGMPQFTGNAVGNVQVGPKGTEHTQNDELNYEYREMRYEKYLDNDWPPYDNADNQNASRMNQSIARAKRYARGIPADGRGHAACIYVAASYLADYQGWGGDSLWREENMSPFPIALSRIRKRLRRDPGSLINAR